MVTRIVGLRAAGRSRQSVAKASGGDDRDHGLHVRNFDHSSWELRPLFLVRTWTLDKD